MIGNNACGSRALGYGRTVRQRRRPRRAHDRRAAAGDRRRQDSAARPARRAGRRAPRDGAHDVRPVHPAGLRLQPRAPAPRERPRPGDRFLVGSEGTLGVVAASDGPAGRGRAVPRARRARLPARCSRPPTPCPPCCTTRWSPARDWTPGSSTWSGASGAVPDLPRGAGWLFAEVTGSTADEARGRGRRGRPGRRRARRATGHRPEGDGGTVADPRGRRRSRRPQPGPARARRLGGRRGPAGPARRLPARVRRPAARRRARRGALRPLRRRLRARPHRLPARPRRRPTARSAPSSRTPPT